MSEEFVKQLEKLDEQDILVNATVKYLFSFRADVADAAFRCAILRWFNPETLQGVLGAGAISDLNHDGQAEMTATDFVEQLQKLKFAEEYPGRGYCFHDLTRRLILKYLQQNQLDFYRQVSAKAVEHFINRLGVQLDQSKQGEIDPSSVDWDLFVEVAYHSFIKDEQEAVLFINEYLTFLLQQGNLGAYHAVIQAASEHAVSGRISPDSKFWIELWRISEAKANDDFTQAENIARQLLESADESINPELIAEATYQLGDSLVRASRYAEARKYLEESLSQLEKLRNETGVIVALSALGDVGFYTENYEEAQRFYAPALFRQVQKVRMPPIEGSEFGSDTPLRVFDTDAWQRRDVYPDGGDKDPEKASVSPNDDDTSQPQIMYFIGFDLKKLGIEPGSENEKGKYEWPIKPQRSLARLWLQIGRVEHALDEYDSAGACALLAGTLFIDSDDLPGAQQAGELLQTLGRNLGNHEYVKSLHQFQDLLLSTAVTNNDKRTEMLVLINQGGQQHAKSEYKAARATFEKAYSLAESLNLTSDKARCLDGLARLSWSNADYEAAAKGFSSALELYKKANNRDGEAITLFTLGELDVARNQVGEAAECFRAAYQIFEQLHSLSSQMQCRLKLSEVAMSVGDYEGAFGYLDQVLELSTKNNRLSSEAETLSKISTLHLSLGHDDQAEATLNQALDISNRIRNKQLVGSILLDRANTLSDMAQYESAAQVYDVVIEADPGNPSAYSGKGWALERLGKEKCEEAIQAYEKAVELSTTDWWVHKSMADVLRVAGDKEKAKVKYRWIINQIEEDGATPVVRSLLAWCYYHLGEYATAKDIYHQVVHSDPNPISDYFDFGIVLICSGQYSEALKAYEEGISFLLRRCPPRRSLGLLYVANEDLRQALETHPNLSEVEEYKKVQEMLITAWEAIGAVQTLTNL